MSKIVKKGKENHFIMTKGSKHQKEIIIINIYTFNAGALKNTE